MATTRSSTSSTTTKKRATTPAAPQSGIDARANSASTSGTTRKQKAKPETEQAVAKQPRVRRTASRKSTANSPAVISAEQRYQMISTAAYFLAEKRGFQGEYSIDDWLVAEKQVDSMLESRHP